MHASLPGTATTFNPGQVADILALFEPTPASLSATYRAPQLVGGKTWDMIWVEKCFLHGFGQPFEYG